jgi:hypothetical protein
MVKHCVERSVVGDFDAAQKLSCRCLANNLLHANCEWCWDVRVAETSVFSLKGRILVELHSSMKVLTKGRRCPVVPKIDWDNEGHRSLKMDQPSRGA